MRSFADDDTEFELVVAETSEGMDGVRRGEPTGEVRCAECGRVADVVEEIPHAHDCPQRGVVSRWWERTFVDSI
jgi:hypothetical protein